MIAPREPQVPAPLVIHEADLNAVAFLLAYALHPEALNAIDVRLERVGVAVEGAGIQDAHHPGNQKHDFVADRVPAGRGRLLHVNVTAAPSPLFLVFISWCEKGTLVRPVDPQLLAIQNEDTADLVSAVGLQPRVVGLFQPDAIAAAD